jgi:outer membrane protein assembly factor BamB
MIPASLVVSLIAFGAGYAAVQIRDVVPIVVRAFPFRPTGFSWKVDTGTKSLVDGSVTAETDRMIMDDEYVYVRIDSKEPTWTVVDRKQHKLLLSESKSLAYVLADDSGGTWQINRNNQEVLCSRVSGMESKRIAVDISQNAVFLEHQTEGLIIGANPESGHLFAFNPKTGDVLWKVQAPPAKNNSDRRIGSIASTGDVIIAGLWTLSRVWAVDVKTGQHLWLFEEAGMGSPMHVEASKSGVVGFSYSDKVYSFSPRTGELKWSKEMGDLAVAAEEDVCLLDDKVIFRNETTITCLNINSGQILWQSNFGDHYSGGIACSDKGIVTCASDRAVAMFDLGTGQEIFRTKLPIRSGTEYGLYDRVKKAPGRIYTHPIVTAEQEVYVFTSDGVLWVLKPKL